MARTAHEIAIDLQQAVRVMAATHREMAEQRTGKSIDDPHPAINVRLADGRDVDLGALTEELIASLEPR